jgi:hypothetical protein
VARRVDHRPRPHAERRGHPAWRTALRILVLGFAVYLLLPRLAGLHDTLDTVVRLR